MFDSLRAVYLIVLGALALPPSAQDITPEMRADINRRVEFQRNWGRMNSQGAELSGVEVFRQAVGKGVSVVKYQLKAKGLPPDIEYELLMLPTMASSPTELQAAGQVHIDKQDNRVMDDSGDPFDLIIPDPAPGEPYRFALVSMDKKHGAFITLFPNPIESTDNGCRVRVVRLLPKFELAFLQLSGFPPRTEVMFHGDSAGEIHEWPLKTNDDGSTDAGILPFKKGLSKGSMEMRVTSSACAPKLSFQWGTTH